MSADSLAVRAEIQLLIQRWDSAYIPVPIEKLRQVCSLLDDPTRPAAWRVNWTDEDIESLTNLAEDCCGLVTMDAEQLAYVQHQAESLIYETIGTLPPKQDPATSTAPSSGWTSEPRSTPPSTTGSTSRPVPALTSSSTPPSGPTRADGTPSCAPRYSNTLPAGARSSRPRTAGHRTRGHRALPREVGRVARPMIEIVRRVVFEIRERLALWIEPKPTWKSIAQNYSRKFDDDLKRHRERVEQAAP